MILNPKTQKYETPPPRWFNKETGEYEDIKPMYFIDPSNPALGFIAPSRIVREDDGFRQFMEDKEAKRRARIERERQEAERARYEALNPPPPPPPPPPKTSKRKTRITVDGIEFDEELAQKTFRERTGKMMSKRGAAQFTGPSTQKDEEYRKELEEKYGALRPLAPEDASIEALPDQVNAEAIIDAWRNSPVIIAPKKRRPRKTEGERVKALVKLRSGKVGWTYAAMRGSYRPPNTIDGAGAVSIGWDENSVPRLIGNNEDPSAERLKGWRQGELESTAWWEHHNRNAAASQWRSRTAMREEQGRLAINPITGKLEDIARPAKTDAKLLDPESFNENPKSTVVDVETGMNFLSKHKLTIDLLMSSPPTMTASVVLVPTEKVKRERITFEQFIQNV
jgi:hypothetical protein